MLRKLAKIFFILVILALGLGLLFVITPRNSKPKIHKVEANYLAYLSRNLQAANQLPIKIKNFTNQTADEVLQVLASWNAQLSQKQNLIDLAIAASKYNPDYIAQFSNWQQEIDEQLEVLTREQKFFRYAALDYRVVYLDDEMSQRLDEYWQAIAARTWPEENSSPDMPVYIEQGQVIGAQGCTGVCTGTHLHFVIRIDDEVLNPCKVMPRKAFSTWGVRRFCGTDNPISESFSWPMGNAWLVTQAYNEQSPVLFVPHEAVDLIDREGAPIKAAHSGYYYTFEKSCAGARICNDKIYVALVCENLGCEDGIVTEYWHMKWHVPGTAATEDMVAELRD